jgi:hypothetical protein
VSHGFVQKRYVCELPLLGARGHLSLAEQKAKGREETKSSFGKSDKAEPSNGIEDDAI